MFVQKNIFFWLKRNAKKSSCNSHTEGLVHKMVDASPVWDPPFHRNLGRLVLGAVHSELSSGREGVGGSAVVQGREKFQPCPILVGTKMENEGRGETRESKKKRATRLVGGGTKKTQRTLCTRYMEC